MSQNNSENSSISSNISSSSRSSSHLAARSGGGYHAGDDLRNAPRPNPQVRPIIRQFLFNDEEEFRENMPENEQPIINQRINFDTDESLSNFNLNYDVRGLDYRSSNRTLKSGTNSSKKAIGNNSIATIKKKKIKKNAKFKKVNKNKPPKYCGKNGTLKNKRSDTSDPSGDKNYYGKILNNIAIGSNRVLTREMMKEINNI